MRQSMKTAKQAESVAKQIMERRFPLAKVAFCAGSIIRGEGTENSDIDLVVIFSQVKNAWRESFMHEGWPVEVLAHDSSTLNYFFREVDARSGQPSLPQMVDEGILVWGRSEEAEPLKSLAKQVLQAGPPNLSAEDIIDRRYEISDLIDDLKAPRSRAEALAIAIRLFPALGDFALRTRQCWSGDGKQLVRAMTKYNSDFCEEFLSSFENFFVKNDPTQIFLLAQKITEPFGGFVFNGYNRQAPASWKLPLDSSQPPKFAPIKMVLKDGESILIRCAREEDAAQLLQSTQESLDDGEGQIMIPSEFQMTTSKEREWIRAMNESPLEILLVAEANGAIIGNIDFHVNKRERLCHAGEFGTAVRPGWRGRGVGTALLKGLILWASCHERLEKINLRVLSSNTRAIALYKNLGFKEEGRRTQQIKYEDGSYTDEVLMGLRVKDEF